MRSQKLLSVFLLLLFFVPGVLFALSGGWQTLTLPSAASIWDGTAAQWTENILAESFAGKDFLCSAAAALPNPALGRNQQNGCFYGEDGILQNLPDADEAITANNLQALQAYSAQTSSPCYFLLSPTAAAIAQQKIPSLALESLFNQSCISSAVTAPSPPSALSTHITGCFPISQNTFFTAQIPASPHWAAIICTSAPGKSWAIPPVPWTISPSPTRCMTIGVI